MTGNRSRGAGGRRWKWLTRLLSRSKARPRPSQRKVSPPRRFAAYEPLFARKRGLEIGGPSPVFRKMIGIYQRAQSVDGVNFATRTIWEGEIEPGQTYRYAKDKVGNQFIAEASDLPGIPDEAYEFVLSSNCLEHIANPLKALLAWRNVLAPGGAMAIVVPFKDSNFDHRRPYTPFAHLLADFEAAVGEDDMTHLDEILTHHDLALDPAAGTPDQFRLRSLDNLANRCLHHHVFSGPVLAESLAFAGMEVIAVTKTETDFWGFARRPP